MGLAGVDRPLEGVRVIAFEQAVSMPFCSFMLAELGADVIKVERTGTGDVIRGWDNVARGLSSGFVWLNANKRDIAIDASHPAGRDVIAELSDRADVFVENFAPGAVERLGLGAGQLMERNPSLIYCSLSGYGQTGPYRDVKAYDLLVQGESGILLANGYPDAPAKIGLPAVDLIAGSNAAMGIISALFKRERSGEGSYLDVAMLDAALPWLGYFPHRFWHQGQEPPRTGLRHQYLCPYGPYLGSDQQYVNVVVASDSHWQRFCQVVERPEWLQDPAFATIAARRDHREHVERHIEAVMAERTSAEWLERLAEAELPHGRVRTVGSMTEHPQAVHRDMFVEASSPVGPLPMVRFPLASAEQERHIPALGEHSDAILRGLGYTAARIAELRNEGVIA